MVLCRKDMHPGLQTKTYYFVFCCKAQIHFTRESRYYKHMANSLSELKYIHDILRILLVLLLVLLLLPVYGNYNANTTRLNSKIR